ncbi:MFS transporter [Streptomyces sp. NBRC 109706]|uniref:MFS transporter n=1 Tax=Streptomyces sp. NBRC 109706 TaxID=1550035 RepID=UPI00082EFF46|nr:MFS transporter [Streptomyces sp. NBRC 109706]
MTTVPTSSSTSTGTAAGRAGGPARPGWLLAVVLAGQFMALLDVFIVNVAAPTLRADLQATDSRLQLIVAGYTIAYAVLLVTGARLGGRFGPGRLYLVGLAFFTVLSLACGLAGDDLWLIVFRVLQGAAAALMIPQVLALIQRSFEGAARARALSLFGAVIAVGAAAGQLLGGLLINADLFGWSWRPVFLVNVPIGLLLLVGGLRVLPLGRPRLAERARSMDLPGLSLLAVAVLLCTVPLVLGQEWGWPAWCWAALASSALVTGVLLAHETRLSRRGGAPLISPRVLVSSGGPMALIFVVMALNGGLTFALALHIQGPESQAGLGYGALRAGLTFLPTALAFGGISLYWRRLPAGWRPALPPVGLLSAAGSLLALGVVLRDGGGGAALVALSAGAGVGLALAYGPTLDAALSRVRREDAADASGMTVMMTQLGMLVGVATFGTLYLNRAAHTASSAEGAWSASAALAAAALAGAALGARGRRSGRRTSGGGEAVAAGRGMRVEG